MDLGSGGGAVWSPRCEDVNGGGNGAKVLVLSVSEEDLRDLIRSAVRDVLGEQARAATSSPLLARHELARLLSVSTATVARMTAEGMPHSYVGSSPRYLLDQVQTWFQERGRKGTKAAPSKRGSAVPGVRLLSRGKP